MPEITCPVNIEHHIAPTTREQPSNFGDVDWYDCSECGISFAVGFKWPDEHPRWEDVKEE